jgi:hypothetical protein
MEDLLAPLQLTTPVKETRPLVSKKIDEAKKVEKPSVKEVVKPRVKEVSTYKIKLDPVREPRGFDRVFDDGWDSFLDREGGYLEEADLYGD